MASNYKVPPLFSEAKPYSRWTAEIKVWQTLTELAPEKQGPALALSLPENEGTIRDKVFNELGVEKLHQKDGVEVFVKFMDDVYKKDELSEAYEVYTDFDRYKRGGNEMMEHYVAEFEKLYNKIKKFAMVLPESVLAFKLLENAGLEHKDRQLILTGVNYSENNTLFKQMALSLRKFFGRQSMPDSSGASSTPHIKIEPTYTTSTVEEEAYYNRRGRRGQRQQGYYNRGRGRGRRYDGEGANVNKRVYNPTGYDGRTLKCKVCESVFHFAKDCPDSYENLEKRKSHDTKEEEFVLFTGDQENELQVLVGEAFNSAILDSACSSTVTGKAWMHCFMDTLDADKLEQVTRCNSETIFKFGGGRKLKSLEKVTFPCEIAGVNCTVTTDVVESDIPLLLGKPAMKAAKVVMDLENDKASFFGREIDLQCTSSGHYCVPLQYSKVPVDQTFEVLYSVDGQTKQEKKKTVQKLHKQFAHPSGRRLLLLLQDAGIQDQVCLDLVDEVTSECDVCLKFKKTPPKPVVGLPLATEFNEVVAMDLKVWKPGVYFLHLIDVATRFSLAAVIKKKTPETIIDEILKLWIGSGFGPPRKFLADNGGEFANSEYRDMAENLNIEVMNTASYSPWQNGLCERNHAVVDTCVSKILADNPVLDLDIALVWAINAKNSLQMTHGWSPYQLVFGSNPNLPSVLVDKPPALEGTTISEVFAKHLNSMHAARKAFIQAESSERIRRALRHNIRPSGTVYQPGDKVYYKRDNQWKGPGKVLGQDGKTVFVRHGNMYVRVATCRLLKEDHAFKRQESPNQSVIVDQEDFHIEDPVVHDITDGPTLSEVVVPTNEPSNEQTAVNNTRVLPKVTDRLKYMLKDHEEWITAKVISRGGKATGKNRGWFNVKENDSDDIKAVNFETDVIQWEKLSDIQDEDVNVAFIPDQRHDEKLVRSAKQSELENWKSFDVYEEVLDQGQPRMSTRWVVTEKVNDERKVIKARLVARGYEEERDVPSDSPTAGKDTLRTVVTITCLRSWQCRTIDVKAAFLQGKNIDREVYLKPPKESDADGKLWKLNKCVYGLNDASRTWYFRVCEELKKLGCQQSKIDPALFYWRQNGRLSGLLMMHVDDFLWSGTIRFQSAVIEKIHQTFQIGKQAHGVFRYIGLEIRHQNGEIMMDQVSYVESLSTIPISSSRASQKMASLTKEETTELRSIIGQISWVANQTRPDVMFDSMELSTSMKDPKVEDLLRANKIVKKMKMEDCRLCFKAIGDDRDLRLAVFSDASYGNLSDGVSSAGGFVVFLIGSDNMCCPIAWKANKIRRVVRSTLAAEAMAMVEGLESVCYLGHLVSELLFASKKNVIPVICYTDNKSLYDNIHSTKSVGEKRLRIDIAGIKQMLERREIARVEWIQSTDQLSDCLTKKGASSAQLLEVLKTGQLRL